MVSLIAAWLGMNVAVAGGGYACAHLCHVGDEFRIDRVVPTLRRANRQTIALASVAAWPHKAPVP